MKQTNLEDIDAFFQKVCEENYADLGNFLLVLTKDREQAQDILQETFIIAWQKRQKLISHPNPAGFLFQTARLCLKSSRRKRSREQNQVVYLDQDELANQSSLKQCPDLIEELLLQQDQSIDEQKWVDVVLSRLTPEEQKLYRSHYIEKKSFVALSQEWKVSQTGLRMRAVRLRRKIQKMVKTLSLEENPPTKSPLFYLEKEVRTDEKSVY